MTVSPALSWTGDDGRSGSCSPILPRRGGPCGRSLRTRCSTQRSPRPPIRVRGCTDDGGVLGVGGSSPRCRGRVPGAAQHLGCF